MFFFCFILFYRKCLEWTECFPNYSYRLRKRKQTNKQTNKTIYFCSNKHMSGSFIIVGRLFHDYNHLDGNSSAAPVFFMVVHITSVFCPCDVLFPLSSKGKCKHFYSVCYNVYISLLSNLTLIYNGLFNLKIAILIRVMVTENVWTTDMGLHVSVTQDTMEHVVKLVNTMHLICGYYNLHLR